MLVISHNCLTAGLQYIVYSSAGDEQAPDAAEWYVVLPAPWNFCGNKRAPQSSDEAAEEKNATKSLISWMDQVGSRKLLV